MGFAANILASPSRFEAPQAYINLNALRSGGGVKRR
jgi:hypothetical protein